MAGLELYGATPWPAASLQHAIPMTNLERFAFCVAHSGVTPKDREQERTFREVFEQIAGEWDWDVQSTLGVKPAEFKTITPVKLTKKMARSGVELFELAMAQKAINGGQCRTLGVLFDRVQWTKDSQLTRKTGKPVELPELEKPKALPAPENGAGPSEPASPEA